MVHGQQVVLPLPVYHLQHEHPFQIAHHVAADLGLLLLVGRLDLRRQLVLEERGGERIDLVLLPGHLHAELRLHGLRQAGQVPVLGVGFLVHVDADRLVQHLLDHPLDDVLDISPLQELLALAVDQLALCVHDVVVFQEVLADLEVVGLHPLLGRLDGPGDPGVFDGLPLLHPQLLHDLADPLLGEEAEQVVFQREEEPGGAGVPLAPRAPAELVVDAPGFVPLRPQDVQAAQLDHPVVLRLGLLADLGEGRGVALRIVGLQETIALHVLDLGQDFLVRGGFQTVPLRLAPPEDLGRHGLRVPAQKDVGTAAGHVGGDGHRLQAARLGDDLRLALGVHRLGVQDLVGNPALLE